MINLNKYPSALLVSRTVRSSTKIFGKANGNQRKGNESRINFCTGKGDPGQKYQSIRDSRLDSFEGRQAMRT